MNMKKGTGMRARRIVLSLAVVTGCTIVTQNSALTQEYRGTWEQQMACTPDVMRLCSDQIPDVGRIVACLRQNTASLGNACRAVFESNASAQPQARQRPRPAPPVMPRPSDDNDE
jgi:hypothetical protein